MNHFHYDLFGNYIPGLCSGLAIQRDDLGKRLPPEKYPILNLLFHEGIEGLFYYVSNKCDFKASDGYMSKCHLCFDLRRHLVLEAGMGSGELQPTAFYNYV